MGSTLFGDRCSGNRQKVIILADHLGLDFDFVEMDILAGDAHRADFRALNPAAQVPVVRFADGRVLAQSYAITTYRAAAGRLVPRDVFDHAAMLQ